MTLRTQPTVLVIDDELDLRSMIAESLSADGFAVAQAADGAEALERIRSVAYDALVLDLGTRGAAVDRQAGARIARRPRSLHPHGLDWRRSAIAAQSPWQRRPVLE